MVNKIEDGVIRLSDAFEYELDEAEASYVIGTGFEELDKNQVIKSGIYAIGGRPSIGRTTFVWQLLNQLAENGESCIYGTYQQKSGDFCYKTLSRKLYSYEGEGAPSTIRLMLGERSRMFGKVAEEISAEQLDLTIISLCQETADDLIKMFETLRGNKQIIIGLDGLEDIPRGREETEGDIMQKLKQFSLETGAIIFLVTRINRQSYNKEIEAESFSSEVMQWSDVVCGLQYYATKMLVEKKKSDIGKLLWELATKSKREMTLKCVKNRFGDKYEVNFQYEAAHDYFQSVEGFSERQRWQKC